jgi:hypothetical protein
MGDGAMAVGGSPHDFKGISKRQAQSSNQINQTNKNFKFQISNSEYGIRNSEFGLEFGVWSLKFEI